MHHQLLLYLELNFGRKGIKWILPKGRKLTMAMDPLLKIKVQPMNHNQQFLYEELRFGVILGVVASLLVILIHPQVIIYPQLSLHCLCSEVHLTIRSKFNS
jgi:hypothetical protein